MSGHNKWSTIKRKKGALDAKKSKAFSRIVKEIAVAVKEAGPEPDMNPRLRLAISNAKGVNMPKDNIQRAISKAGGDGTSYYEVTFEGHGPGGVSLFVECLTDNNNRTVADVRSVFNKRGGTLGTNGSLAFIFERKGIFAIPKGNLNAEELELEVIDAGAEDFQVEDDEFIITTSFEDFKSMQRKLEDLKIEATSMELQRIATTLKHVEASTAKSVMKMIEMFEESDDVQNVFHNMELTDEIMAALEEE
jgi:YebC/PmpR family DNA-binding regulatory protein